LALIVRRKANLSPYLIVFLVVLSLLAGCKDSGSRGKQPLVVDGPAPAFELVDTGGRDWKLSELRGKVVLVNFWATWCSTCVEEMPSIHNLNVLASGADGFQILTVLYQDSPEKAIEHFRREGYAMPILIDKRGSASSMYGLTGVPETFIIDKKGILRSKYIGPRRFDSTDMVQLLNGLLEEPS
jgi:peroxiredoxin